MGWSKPIVARAANSQMQLRDLPGQSLTASKPSPWDRCSLGTGSRNILEPVAGAVNGASTFIKKTQAKCFPFATGFRDSLGSASLDDYNLSDNSTSDAARIGPY